jgi:hypothetical protein
MTRCGLEVRRTSAHLLLSLLAVALCAGCLNAGPEVQSVEASAGGASDGPAETSKKSTSGAGDMPEATTVAASQIEGYLAGAADASSGVPFVAKTQTSGGSGYDADTVLAVRYEVNEDYERAVIDLGTGLEPAAPVPEWSLVSQEGNGLLRVSLPSASATCVSDGEFGDGLLKSYYAVHAPEGACSWISSRARRSSTGWSSWGPRAPRRRLQAEGRPEGAAPRGGRRHCPRRATPERQNLRPPHSKRLLPQLRSRGHHYLARFERKGLRAKDRPWQRQGPYLRILRSDPGSTAVLWNGDPESRDRKRPRPLLRRHPNPRLGRPVGGQRVSEPCLKQRYAKPTALDERLHEVLGV